MKNAVDDYIGAVDKAYDETHKWESTYEGISADTNADPYALRAKSVEELNTLLEETQKYKDDVIADESDPFGAQKALAAARKIAAIEKELQSWSNSVGRNTPTPSITPDKTTEKWEAAHKAALGLIADFEAKEKSGIARIEADINGRVAAMVERIEAAEGATAKMNDEVKKKLYEAAGNLRNAKVQEYLDQVAKKVNQLKASMNSTQENKYIAEAENALHSEMTDISHKMLSQTLHRLEKMGLISRTVYPEVPPRVDYALTDLGQTLIPHLSGLIDWANEHFEAITKNI